MPENDGGVDCRAIPLLVPPFANLRGICSQDSHAFIHSFGGISGQGFFAVYDGHAGKAAADWCGVNVHAVRGRVAHLGSPHS
jgi:serine/threonine protein phosphatase PrpC